MSFRFEPARRRPRAGDRRRWAIAAAALHRRQARRAARGRRATTRPSMPAREGAVAAPTAGLHFTDATVGGTASSAASRRHFVTLHVGAGTFLPVKADDTARASHACRVGRGFSRRPPQRLNAVRARGRPHRRRRHDVAAAARDARPSPMAASQPFAGETRLFITPGYRFRAVDLLMTNFHLPRSTLFMLVAAFAGSTPCSAPTPTPSRRATASIPTATPACSSRERQRMSGAFAFKLLKTRRRARAWADLHAARR